MTGDNAPEIKIFLLGRFAVEVNGVTSPQSAWKRRRPVEIITSLALAPGFVLHREELIDRLWPEKDLDAGANNLYRALHDLRRLTDDNVVTVERGAVRLHESTWIDVVAFEEAVASTAVERVLEGLELYRGDLLPDDPYSDAIGPRRQGLRQRFVDASLRVTRKQDDLDADRRIELLRKLVEIDPTLEEAHRLLMTALARVGRVKDAARQFAVCVESLGQQLGVGPSSETKLLLQRIKNGEIQPSRAQPLKDNNWTHVADRLLGTSAPRPIRGRSQALLATQSFAKGDCGALFIVGEAGAGKTRLAVECARSCAGDRGVVLAGLGYDFEGAAPYTPFVDAWTDLLRLMPGGDNPFLSFRPTPGGSAQEDRLRLFRAVEESLTAIAGDGVVCVLIEDLHQADESSLYLFHHLVRASRHLPLKLIGTVRAEDVDRGNPIHGLLSSLDRERQTVRIHLERLDLSATRELVRDLWSNDPDPRALETIYRLAGGNPFFTEEIATAFSEGNAENVATSGDLLQTVRDRVGRLGTSAERLLIAASVQSVRFDFEIARHSINMETEAALDALDAALSARVIEEHEGRYRFRHALMREALADSISHARRVYLHRMTAQALEDGISAYRENEPELLAHHHQLAGNIGQALHYTVAAIERAQSRLGFGEAVTHSERAVELMDTLGIGPGQQQFEVLRNMGAMRVALGDLDEAVANLTRAAEMRGTSGWTPEPVQQCGAHRMAALALIEAGNLADAEVRLDAALAALGEDRPPTELCNVFYLYAQLRWHQSRHPEAFELAERCLEVAEKSGNVDDIARGYEMLALACHSLGEWKKGRDFEEQRNQVADGALDVASAFDVHL